MTDHVDWTARGTDLGLGVGRVRVAVLVADRYRRSLARLGIRSLGDPGWCCQAGRSAPSRADPPKPGPTRSLIALAAALSIAACSAPPPRTIVVPTAPTVADSIAARCQVTDGRADSRCTPGELNPAVTQATIGSTICVSGWTATVRPPASYTDSLKRSQKIAYGEVNAPDSALEEDHLINLGIGGHPRDSRNLWPQPRTGVRTAAMKDQEETELQRAVCAGTITLAQAQTRILADWLH